MLLFRKEELRRVRRTGAERSGSGREPDEEYDAVEFAINSATLRERLDVLGMGARHIAEVFADLVTEEHARLSQWIVKEHSETAYNHLLSKRLQVLSTLTLDSWKHAVQEAFRKGETRWSRVQPESLGWLLELWESVDARLVLRAIIETFPTSEVVLDVTDLLEGGWFETDEDPRDVALTHFGWVIANGAPVIVLTEGSSDVGVLSQALQVLRPHLEGFLRFPDFSVGAEGGAGALVRLLKALWAAGVANRVVALFDNDTAAADALRSLNTLSLPANLRVLTLPDIEVGRHYPTIGPSGMNKMNVNGLAGSLELYLGIDVLREHDGSLRPVQWTGYNPRLGRYQGELVGKSTLHDRFRAKAEDALTARGPITGQDWTGLNLVFDALLACLE
jgi:hypothetical protein